MKKQKQKLYFTLFFTVLTLSFCSAAPKAGGSVVVRAEKVTEAEDYETRHYTGQAVSKSVVSIVARVSGEILELGFKDGDVVRKGQVLYKLDPVQYEAAVKGIEASIEKCKAELTYAQSNFNRINLLYQKQASSLDTMENAKATLGAAKAALLAAEAELIRQRTISKTRSSRLRREDSSASPPSHRETTSRQIREHFSRSFRFSRSVSAFRSAQRIFSRCSAVTRS